MTAKEWLGVIQQAEDYNPAMTNLIEKYGELLSEQESIGFFIWYGVKIAGLVEYITKIKPITTSQEMEEKIIEFEGKPIKGLYQLYLKSKEQK